LDDPEVASMLTDVMVLTGAVVERIGWGDNAGAAEQFVETVALGPGMWAQLPEGVRKTMIENAPTFLDEARDPGQIEFNPVWLRGFSKPCLLTKGDHSPPPFAPVVAKLATTVRQAEVVTVPGAGHNPHQSHPDAYVDVILNFVRRHATA
jgi:pimeloyl-ACP methyl ester carboxylesterase